MLHDRLIIILRLKCHYLLVLRFVIALDLINLVYKVCKLVPCLCSIPGSLGSIIYKIWLLSLIVVLVAVSSSAVCIRAIALVSPRIVGHVFVPLLVLDLLLKCRKHLLLHGVGVLQRAHLTIILVLKVRGTCLRVHLVKLRGHLIKGFGKGIQGEFFS